MRLTWFTVMMLLFGELLFAQTNLLPNGDLETLEPNFWHSYNSGMGGATVTWATDEAAPNPWNTNLPSWRSFKVEKPSATTDAVGWESENNADMYWNNAGGNLVYTLRFWAKTMGVNTNPANEDEQIGVYYRFYSGGNLIAEQFVAVDQSASSVDWTEYQGALLVPSEPDDVTITAVLNKDATGTVWFDNIDCWTDPWSMGVFGGDAETPEGWLYWTSSSKVGEARLVQDPNAHSGSYSALLYEKDNQDDEMVFYSEPVAATPGKWYKIRVWARTDSINTGADWYATNVTPDRDDSRLGVTFFFHRSPIDVAWDLTGGDQFFYFDQRTAQSGWTQYIVIAQAPADAAGVSMRARFTSCPTGYTWYDDFSIQEINDVITIIEDHPTPVVTIPTDYMLKQNYPNPFNPETIIEYIVPEQGHVQLNIYNMLGQRVRTLVDEVRSPGTYQVFWDGRDDFGNRVATGVYIYQLRGKNALITKRMILIK